VPRHNKDQPQSPWVPYPDRSTIYQLAFFDGTFEKVSTYPTRIGKIQIKAGRCFSSTSARKNDWISRLRALFCRNLKRCHLLPSLLDRNASRHGTHEGGAGRGRRGEDGSAGRRGDDQTGETVWVVVQIVLQ
jgi:hypothetical protein